jgi:hypothetical protein
MTIFIVIIYNVLILLHIHFSNIDETPPAFVAERSWQIKSAKPVLVKKSSGYSINRGAVSLMIV